MIGNEHVKVYTRCRYWPRCSNRKCKFVHPVYECKFDKNCPYDNLCAFRHSSDPVPENLTGYYRGRRKSKTGPSNIGRHASSTDDSDNDKKEDVGQVDNQIEEPESNCLPDMVDPPNEWEAINARFDLGAAVPMVRNSELESACFAFLTRDLDATEPTIERNVDASPFPNTVFLSRFFGNEQLAASSSSLNFEDCGSLMSWSHLEENTTLGPRLTVASMKKIWQDIPNSYSRPGLAR
ncbi:hypothetical protein Unana1_01877 [Umbelopsis nana]